MQNDAKRPTRWWYWWPFLLGPYRHGRLLPHISRGLHPRSLQTHLRGRRPALTSTAVGLGILRLGRTEYHLLILPLAASILFAIHGTGPKRLHRRAVLAVGVALAKAGRPVPESESIRAVLADRDRHHVLSKAIARRAFRHPPRGGALLGTRRNWSRTLPMRC